MKIAAVFVSALLAIGVCAPAEAAAGWTDSAVLSEVNQQPTTGVGATLVFIEIAVTVNPSGCSHATGFYFAVTDDRTNRLFGMLLAAQLAGREVKIYTDGTCHSPWNYARLDGVIVN
jgi:hypothetical protein